MSLRLDAMNTLRDAQRDMGNEHFLWRGVQIPCVASSETRTTIIDQMGNSVEVDYTLFVQIVCLLTSDSTIFSSDDTIWTSDNEGKPVPLAGRNIEFRGREYKVIQVKLAGTRSHYALALGDPTSGRGGRFITSRI